MSEQTHTHLYLVSNILLEKLNTKQYIALFLQNQSKVFLIGEDNPLNGSIRGSRHHYGYLWIRCVRSPHPWKQDARLNNQTAPFQILSYKPLLGQWVLPLLAFLQLSLLFQSSILPFLPFLIQSLGNKKLKPERQKHDCHMNDFTYINFTSSGSP